MILLTDICFKIRVESSKIYFSPLHRPLCEAGERENESAGDDGKSYREREVSRLFSLSVVHCAHVFFFYQLFLFSLTYRLLVSLAAIFWMSRNAPPRRSSFGGALRDIQKTAVRETNRLWEPSSSLSRPFLPLLQALLFCHFLGWQLLLTQMMYCVQLMVRQIFSALQDF